MYLLSKAIDLACKITESVRVVCELVNVLKHDNMNVDLAVYQAICWTYCLYAGYSGNFIRALKDPQIVHFPRELLLLYFVDKECLIFVLSCASL